MAKGVTTAEYFPRSGQVRFGDTPNWDFIYKTSLVKDRKWAIGDRVVLPDGRVFRYCKSAGALPAGLGAYNDAVVNIAGSAPVQTSPATGAVGSNILKVTIASGDGYAEDGAIAEDELRGAYVVFGHEGSGTAQTRYIVGNTAVASGGGSTYLTLDGGITTAITAATTYIEVLLNPYGHLKQGNTAGLAMNVCVPITNVAAASTYFWGQTWGPIWLTPGGAWTSQGVANERLVVFVGDGSINGPGATGVTLETGFQVAGYIMQKDTAGSGGPPFVMLMISP